MPATIGTGFLPSMNNATRGSSAGGMEDTIKRLEKELEKYRREQESSDSRLLDRKISSLEDRIANLRERLDKVKSDDGECETCKNRKYQDGSDDPGVSFKSPSKVSAGSAESAVRGHEQEHVTRNRDKAEREGKEIVYQSVRIKTGICPECGDTYVSGGETTTVTRARQDERFNVGLIDMQNMAGNLLDITV